MERDPALKRFDPRVGKTLDLFSTREGRLPIVLEILESPWITRGSELPHTQDTHLGKRRDEHTVVVWNERAHEPATFSWRTRTYIVEDVIQIWTIERYWWNPEDHVSQRCWRVLAHGGTYDLAYDRLRDRWIFLGEQD